ncbi:SDR family NAD(P)-dependent oxidoreductase [Risungbinella massiliensis]|uniref:SDR family NAD(P)-dependent oxidoreductase n=1 Tax=Risungbinella massiliensis TaxID=1329796 RepID=UPI0005CC1EC3|nr:SDR family oxidoreductase [Risungbinella massiliensis]
MLEDKVVIVTGAGSGIGKEIARECIGKGATVLACDLNEVKLHQLSEEIASNRLSTYSLDVSDLRQVEGFFQQIYEYHPRINALINNAGIYFGKSMLDYEENEVDQVLNVNVKGYIYFTKFFAKMLLQDKRKGCVVNISSVSGEEGSSDAIYGLSKAAILGLTKSNAINFAPYIRVNAVAPTIVDTSMMEQIPKWRKDQYVNQSLLQKSLLPSDVANSVIFLLSDLAGNYTGATLDINNGCYLR